MFVVGRHCCRRTAARHHKRIIQCVALLDGRHSSSSIVTADVDRTSNTNSERNASNSNLRQTKNPYYPRMFAPLFLGPDIGSLPNRVIMGSMHTGLEGHSIPAGLLWAMNVASNDDHRDMTKMAMYFEERAKGGVGLMGEFATRTHLKIANCSYIYYIYIPRLIIMCIYSLKNIVIIKYK